MCVNCVTSAESVVANSVIVAAISRGAWERARDLLAGRSASQRRAEIWDANARFLASMGHEPEAVLGTRPVVEPGPAPALTRLPLAPATALEGSPAWA